MKLYHVWYTVKPDPQYIVPLGVGPMGKNYWRLDDLLLIPFTGVVSESIWGNWR
ncbi:MAG: hypothetical protein HN472_02090 [Nitrospina sp.]|nr:hypothetical protein [Nitrospina sp.]MBT3508318.1 hypothetical protein [Nitrospina sp.]MBT3874740.1 hypothetical protein [Nitrospina sp.]MBT4049474.1 hypothetical protein [Nitrospina sp.]MBT4558408.1 hypothetical protein [Nitrospina sp.]